MRAMLLASVLIAAPLAACGQSEGTTAADATSPAAAPAPALTAQRADVGATATAPLTNGQGGQAGTATFSQGPQGVVIRIEATGLTPGWHGIHLHETGTCEGPGFQSAGAHVHGGSTDVVHGLLNTQQNDFGDLPNIYADAQGRAYAEVFTTFARLADSGPGAHLLDADGSAIVIHAQPDDHNSQPIGGSGDRVACGVIAAG